MIEFYYIPYLLNNWLRDVIWIPSIEIPSTCAICNQNYPKQSGNSRRSASEMIDNNRKSAIAWTSMIQLFLFLFFFILILYNNSSRSYNEKECISIILNRAKNLISPVSRSNKIEGYEILKIWGRHLFQGCCLEFIKSP